MERRKRETAQEKLERLTALERELWDAGQMPGGGRIAGIATRLRLLRG